MKQISDSHDLLRFSTAGSVDDGKSTLIGRLLVDTKAVFEDQLAAVETSTKRRGREGVDLALIMDGLQAEREQGITIDVAYRYFATPRRKFIIADTPGHEQYTRNMVTGASTADLALILVDARKGLKPQSRRHAYIATLLGIKHILVCVNKMDLVDWREEMFVSIKDAFTAFVKDLYIPDLRFVPISALSGENVVNPTGRMPWYEGPTVLEVLEALSVIQDQKQTELRLPVQYVNRPHAGFRGYAGTIAGGLVRPGQDVVVLPAGHKTRIKEVVGLDGPLSQAQSPMAVTVTLEDALDVSRGDMLVSPENMPTVVRQFTAKLCWMAEEALVLRRRYILKHGTRLTKAMVETINHRVNINTLEKEKTSEFKLNEIGEVQIKSMAPLPVDSYSRNRTTGSFILIDETTYNTVAGGMIV